MKKNQIIPFKISSVLRDHKVTMREFCKSVGITLIRFREIRAAGKCVRADAEIFQIHCVKLSERRAA